MTHKVYGLPGAVYRLMLVVCRGACGGWFRGVRGASWRDCGCVGRVWGRIELWRSWGLDAA